METVLRPGCALPARFGLGVGCRACVLSRCQASLALASDEAREGKKKEGKIPVCRALCFSENAERDGFSLSRLALPAGKCVRSEDFYF